MKIVSVLFVLTLLLFAVGCTVGDGETPNTEVPQLARDVPVPLGAVPVSGYKTGYLTNIIYKVAEEPDTVKDWYTANIPSVWEVDKPWFGFGANGEAQLFLKTSDFMPNPNARAGRQVVVAAGQHKSGSGTQLLIMYVDYTQP